MVRTLKDSFWNSIEYVTYQQEKDEELLKFLVLFLDKHCICGHRCYYQL